MSYTHWNTRLTLLEKIKNRQDEQAWEDFVYYYQGYVRVILSSMNVSYGDIDELNNTIMIKLWQKLPDFEYCSKKARFRSWLCHVIQNEARDHFRKLNALNRKIKDVNEEEYIDIIEESELEKLAEREWNIYIAERAWENVAELLPKHYQEVFKLHLKSKSVKEIMEECGMNYNTVNVCLKRCREKLKVEIKQLTNELL